MAKVKFVLTERFLAHQEAVELAKNDSTIDLQEAAEVQEVRPVEDVPVANQPAKKFGTARKAELMFKIKAAQTARSRQVVTAT